MTCDFVFFMPKLIHLALAVYKTLELDPQPVAVPKDHLHSKAALTHN